MVFRLLLCLAALALACRREGTLPEPRKAPPASGTAAAVASTPTGATPTTSPSTVTDCVSVERVGGEISPPVEVSRVAPRYPDATGHRFSSGLFIVEAVIDRDGIVHDAHFLQTATITPALPSFNQAILDSISRWRYRPATHGGEAVCVYLTVTVTIHFR